MKKFGEKVKEIRESLGYTQDEVYNMTGISQETQRVLERGVRDVSLTTLRKLSVTYKTDLYRVMSDTREENDPLSASTIVELYDIYNGRNNEEFKELLENLGTSTKKLFADSKRPFELNHVDYFNVFSDLDNDEFRFKDIDIVILEKLLDKMAKTDSGRLGDARLFDIEIATAIQLSILYRKSNRPTEAVEVLVPCYEFLSTINLPTGIDIRHMGSVIVNIAYGYHRESKDEKVIEFITKALENENYPITQAARTEINLRLGVAHHNLGHCKKAYDYFTMILMSEKGKRFDMYATIIKETYECDHHLIP